MHDITKVLLTASGLFLMSLHSWGLTPGQVKPLPTDTLLNRALSLLPDYADSSAAYAEAVLRIAIDDNVDSLLFKSNQLLGYAYYYKGDYRKSNFFYKKTLGTQYIATHPQAAASVYNNIGIYYEILDEYDKAIDTYLQSILAEESIGNMDGKYMTWINLSILSAKINDIKEAKRYARGALRYFESRQDSIQIALCHQNLGVAYTMEQKFDSAMIYNQQALSYYLEQDLKFDYLQILFNTVVNHLQQGNLDLAQYYLKKAQPLRSYIDSDILLSGTYKLYQGRLMLETGNGAKARVKLEEALHLLKQTDIKNYQVETLDNILKSFVPAAQLPEYKNYMNEFRRIRSEMFSQEVASNLSKAKVEFDVAILEKNLELQEAQTQLHQRLNQGLLIILSLITAAALIIYLLWRKQRSQNKALFQLNQDLTEKWKISNLQAYQKHGDLFQDIHSIMEDKKLYANPDLTINTLASAIGSNQKYVSESINTHHGGNFFQFVNAYRIEHAKQLLLRQPELTMEAIADSSGFSSRSTFYRAFKKATGMSPGAYAEQGKYK